MWESARKSIRKNARNKGNEADISCVIWKNRNRMTANVRKFGSFFVEFAYLESVFLQFPQKERKIMCKN